jgi:oligoribonuclease
VPEPRSVPLCGNSIGTDRRFLARYLPAIEDHLHYRCVDVSTIKELARRWYPSLDNVRPFKIGAHRALDDIRDSVRELQFYRERVFVTAPPIEDPRTAAAPAPTPQSPSAGVPSTD